MLQWIKMDLEVYQWTKWAGLGGVFDIEWFTSRKDLLKVFLQTWEETKDGHVKAQFCGKQILILVLIHKLQLSISCEDIIDFANATIQEGKFTLRKIARPHVLVENEQWNIICMKE